MKIMFGFVGVLIVLAIAASLLKTQLSSLSASSRSAAQVMDAGSNNDAAAPTARERTTSGETDALSGAMATERQNVQQQSIRIQNQVREAVNRNLQQGAERSAE